MDDQNFALVVGCDYPDTDIELKGCGNDAYYMMCLSSWQFGFQEKCTVSLGDYRRSTEKPTASVIKMYLKRHLSLTRAGGVCFFYFAGHGTIVPAAYSSTGRDEQAIVASDFNLITSVDFRQILNGAPDGVSLVIISDSCNSGGLIDKEQEQIGPRHPPQNLSLPSIVGRSRSIPFEVVLHLHSLQNHVNDHDHVRAHFNRTLGSEASLVFQSIPPQPRLRPGQGILLSGCQPDEESKERFYEGRNHGVFTTALLKLMLGKPRVPITNRNLMLQLRTSLQRDNFVTQHPCLYCSETNVDAFFL